MSFKRNHFSIELLNSYDFDGGVQHGEITLEEGVERFESSLGFFSAPQYEKQWDSAINTAVLGRNPSCLIVDIVVADSGIGKISIFSLIPSELARGSRFFNISNEGIFITQSILTITINPLNLLNKIMVTLEDGTTLWEEAVYYFDSREPSRFYAYVNTSIADVSSWYYCNDAFTKDDKIS